jgi:hypothetical protein
MRLAVIVPVLNEERHLGTFLTSIGAQTRQPERLLLVDDGSSDRACSSSTVDIARAFDFADHRSPGVRESARS